MASEKVSQMQSLPASSVEAGDLLLITDVSAKESKKITAADFLTYIESTGSFGQHSILADTASYILGTDVDGIVKSSSYSLNSDTSSYSFKSILADTASNASTASMTLMCVTHTITADTASFLNYSGFFNGTSSYSLLSNLSNFSNTASVLTYIPGVSKNTASYAISASTSILSVSSSHSDTSSYSISSSFSNTSSYSNYSANSFHALSSSVADTASYINPTSLPPQNTTYTVATPYGSISYKNYQFIWNHNPNNYITYLSYVNNITNNISFISSSMWGEDHINVSMVMSDSGNKYIVGSTSGPSIYMINLLNNNYSRLPVYGASLVYIVIKIDDLISGSSVTPAFYLVPSDINYSSNAIQMLKSYYNSGWHQSQVGVNLDLINIAFYNSTEFKKFEPVSAHILFFSFNPIKKRFYLITNGSSYLHIFNINAYSGTVEKWWVESNRYQYFQYEKSIALRGNDAYWIDSWSEHYSLEYDFDTGQEIAITCVREGSVDRNGSVIKIPWFEG